MAMLRSCGVHFGEGCFVFILLNLLILRYFIYRELWK